MFFGRKKDAGEAWNKSQGKGSELRAFPRMSIKTLVTVRSANRESHCRLHDLSLGGLAFIAPWQLVPDDRVTLSLPPPEGIMKAPKYPAAIDAVVCRTIPSQKYPGSFQVGVKFVNPNADAQTIIRLWFESFGEAPEKGRGR
jgi:hypothetical protein